VRTIYAAESLDCEVFSVSHGRWVRAKVLHNVPSAREIHVRYQLPGEDAMDKWLATDSPHLRLSKDTERELQLPAHEREMVAHAANVISQGGAEHEAQNGALVHQAMVHLAGAHRDVPAGPAASVGAAPSQSQVGSAHVAELRERTHSEARVQRRAVEIAAVAQAAERTMENELASTERELSSLQSELGIHPHDEDVIYSVVEEQHEAEIDDEEDDAEFGHYDEDKDQDGGSAPEDEDVFAPTSLASRGMQAFQGELTAHIIGAGARSCRCCRTLGLCARLT
jgi:hypothetical protein